MFWPDVFMWFCVLYCCNFSFLLPLVPGRPKYTFGVKIGSDQSNKEQVTIQPAFQNVLGGSTQNIVLNSSPDQVTGESEPLQSCLRLWSLPVFSLCSLHCPSPLLLTVLGSVKNNLAELFL